MVTAEMRPRALLLAMALVAGAVAATVAVSPAGPAGADPHCSPIGADGQCVGDVGGPGPGGTPGGSGGDRPPRHCAWVEFADQAYGHSLWPPPDNHFPNNTMVFEDCGRPAGNGAYDPWERVGVYGDYSQFLSPNFVVPRAVTWDDPEEVAEDRWAEIAATLPGPIPITSPPGDLESILDVPVFVAVSNWRDEIHAEGSDGPVSIGLVAVPSLAFDPGDGSSVIDCTGAGTVYDDSSELTPDQQAEGACAHPYDRHTVDGDTWPGDITVTWTVTWSSQTPDDGGTFDFSLPPVPLPRPVDEVTGLTVGNGEAVQ